MQIGGAVVVPGEEVVDLAPVERGGAAGPGAGAVEGAKGATLGAGGEPGGAPHVEGHPVRAHEHTAQLGDAGQPVKGGDREGGAVVVLAESVVVPAFEEGAGVGDDTDLGDAGPGGAVRGEHQAGEGVGGEVVAVSPLVDDRPAQVAGPVAGPAGAAIEAEGAEVVDLVAEGGGEALAQLGMEAAVEVDHAVGVGPGAQLGVAQLAFVPLTSEVVGQGDEPGSAPRLERSHVEPGGLVGELGVEGLERDPQLQVEAVEDPPEHVDVGGGDGACFEPGAHVGQAPTGLEASPLPPTLGRVDPRPARRTATTMSITISSGTGIVPVIGASTGPQVVSAGAGSLAVQLVGAAGDLQREPVEGAPHSTDLAREHRQPLGVEPRDLRRDRSHRIERASEQHRVARLVARRVARLVASVA